MFLFNPQAPDPGNLDEPSLRILQRTIRFFEDKGKTRIKEDDRKHVWYADFLEFVKQEQVFATFLTPARHGAGPQRWDTYRNARLNEVLGFYGLAYWYPWQVSILGLGPVWMSQNETVQRRAAELLRGGAVFAFGLSERDHGADVYSTEMALTPQPDGTWLASGSKYYIGNGNEAPLVSTLGKFRDTGEFVFFAAGFGHERYELVKNVVASQNYVAEFALHDYPVGEDDIIARGDRAWDAAMNTVNIGKYNLGWASIGMCTHAFYEAIDHASGRILYGNPVTRFPHVRNLFVDAYARLVAMRLFALRAADYMRVASAEDRRYLLYNAVVKMKVTTEGEQVINQLWDVIAAKGFEKDTFFEMAARDIRALPKLEGTVHVNIALITKFMSNYFFKPAPYAEVPRQDQAADDAFLFSQGPARRLGKVRFHDYRPAFAFRPLPNVKTFARQAAVFKQMLALARPGKDQRQDVDFLLAIGQLFTQVVYGQLVLENAVIYGIDDDTVDQIFAFMVRDFSAFALQLRDKPSATRRQRWFCGRMMKRPAMDADRFDRVWTDRVEALRGVYAMND
ncbi:acyl-CoA dehydrogenase [bacterium]|nr:acyl-CoA dehydrogenase [bacterium]